MPAILFLAVLFQTVTDRHKPHVILTSKIDDSEGNWLILGSVPDNEIEPFEVAEWVGVPNHFDIIDIIGALSNGSSYLDDREQIARVEVGVELKLVLVAVVELAHVVAQQSVEVGLLKVLHLEEPSPQLEHVHHVVQVDALVLKPPDVPAVEHKLYVQQTISVLLQFVR